MNKQSGFALVIVIWVLMLLTIMAGSFSLTMRREISVISSTKNNAASLSAAETGLAVVQQMLLLDDVNQRWRGDGSIYELQFGNADIRVRLFSEQGKIDINKADEILLTALCSAVIADLDKQQALVSAILDWRDKDDLIRVNGAEKTEYEAAGLSYHPANKKFQLMDELQMVLGMNAEIFARMRPLITVFSSSQEVSLDVAPREVLRVLSSLDDEALDEYLLQRRESNLEQTAPPPFPDLQALGTTGNTDSRAVYTVIAQASLDGEVGSGIIVTLKKAEQQRDTHPFQILDWREIHDGVSLFADEMNQYLVAEQNGSE